MAASIHRAKSWQQPGLEETPEWAFLNRRQLLKKLGHGAAIGGLAMAGGLSGASMRQAVASEDPSAGLYPAKPNLAYRLDRELTPEDINSTYNNFYEFGSHKQIARAAQALRVRPWTVTIDGMVEQPMELGIDDLLAKMDLEERLYRHRCVEAWSMTIPWSGFPLKALVEMAQPLSSAKYVRMETFLDRSMASGQNQFWYPWPYVEGMTIDEAVNELSFMVTGAYGKPLAKQFGSPLRLALPWKYGFKSIKSVVKISFTEERPVSFWEEVAANEYGFWANVNPEVPHPRWSQAQERILHTGEKVPTLLFNGYSEQVAHLYEGLEGEKLYM